MKFTEEWTSSSLYIIGSLVCPSGMNKANLISYHSSLVKLFNQSQPYFSICKIRIIFFSKCNVLNYKYKVPSEVPDIPQTHNLLQCTSEIQKALEKVYAVLFSIAHLVTRPDLT